MADRSDEDDQAHANSFLNAFFSFSRFARKRPRTCSSSCKIALSSLTSACALASASSASSSSLIATCARPSR